MNIKLNWEVWSVDQFRTSARGKLSDRRGIYVWIWRKTKDVAYIGETKISFAYRNGVHIKKQLASMYPVFDYDYTEPYAQFLKRELHGKDRDQLALEKKVLRSSFSDDPEYAKKLASVAKVNLDNTIFAFAPLLDDALKVRRQVEAMLIKGVTKHYSSQVGVELASGIPRWKLPLGKIESIKEADRVSIHLSHGGSKADLERLPNYFLEIRE